MNIWKFPINFDTQYIPMPLGADIISFGKQKNEMFVWALVDPDALFVKRFIEIVGTGHNFYNSRQPKHIQTIQDGPYVWHALDFGEEMINEH
jgi:hypothetical protein